MTNLTRLFHVIHVVDDLGAAESFYERILAGRSLFRGGYSPVEQRDASLFAIGDFAIEPMTPSREAGANEKPVGRFLARFGAHLHSIAFYVRSVEQLWARLRARGVRIVGDGGAALAAPPKGAIYTHPRDTGGLLEFMEPPADPESGFDLRLRPDWSSRFWSEEHPLGIAGASHLTLVVRDLERARGLWVETLEGRPFLERESRALGTRSLFVAAGQEVVVELAQPVDRSSAAARELTANGEILHGVTFRVRDLARAEAFLRDQGLEPAHVGADLELGPDQALGARFRFSEAGLPGDPRNA
jgi:catechol 2,3-dioxygenase-like lactoylglutathione lyase family enzyme